ncbi:hypothetical protein F4824DRAFT_500393 [Ustulina deusta]|nr:hypothetical protein F4824DRAFT_500393 [Ustulina deusta]
MSPDHAISNQITASDMMAVAKVNWEKLAAKAGFQDGATAKAHYEPLLNPDPPAMRSERDRARMTIKPLQSESRLRP